jgi:hypothetical protein
VSEQGADLCRAREESRVIEMCSTGRRAGSEVTLSCSADYIFLTAKVCTANALTVTSADLNGDGN